MQLLLRSKMNNQTLAFVLRPKPGPALDACYLAHNNKFLRDNRTPPPFSREATPSTVVGDEDEVFGKQEAHFTLGQILKDGFISFGSDPKRNHFLLLDGEELKKPENRHRPKLVSREHFTIAFNEKGDLVLHSSPNAPAIGVTYNGQLAEKENRRKGLSYTLLPRYQIEIVIHYGFVFQVRVEELDSNKLRSEIRRARIHDVSKLPRIPNLNLDSQLTTAADSAVLTRQKPLYIQEKEIGKGQYGIVYIARNVHTGHRYAKKVAYPNKSLLDEIGVLQTVSHVSGI